jgi:hypothetical protein
MSNNSPQLPNMMAALVEVKDRAGNFIGRGFLIKPWNTFFQQFVQQAPIVSTISGTSFTANINGTVIFTGGAPVITLTRGTDNIVLTGQRIVPVSVGDTVSWVGATTVQFLGA